MRDRKEFLAKKFEELRNQREEKKRLRPLATSLRLTTADIEYALREHGGNLLHASRFLGVDRALLKRKIDSFPSLQRLMVNLQEETLDEAEAQLVEQVKDGYFPAISMYLRTKGKERGYTEKFTNEYELGENATRSAAALIEAMRRGAEPKAIEEKESYAIEVKEYTVDARERTD